MFSRKTKLNTYPIFGIIFALFSILIEFFSFLNTDILSDAALNTLQKQIEIRCNRFEFFSNDYWECLYYRLGPWSIQANKYVSSDDRNIFLLDDLTACFYL